MTDYSRDRLGPQDEDRLPWLEPVEEEFDEPGGITTGKLLMWAVVALAVIGLIVGGFLWLRGRDAGTAGDGGLIKAPDAYYKERPAEDAAPAEGDEIVYSASKGNEVESVIDISGAAETPVNVDRPATAAAAPAIKPAPAAPTAVVKTAPVPPAAKPAAPSPSATVDQAVIKQAPKAPPKPKPAPVAAAAPIASGGSMVQLGAFSSEAKANSAWKTLSARFSFLSGLSNSVVAVQSGDKTLYRLRASGGNAGDICKRLRTAGESCSVIG